VLGGGVGDLGDPGLAADPAGDLGAQVRVVGGAEFGRRRGEQFLAACGPERSGVAADLAGQVSQDRPAVPAWLCRLRWAPV
jgi:hypothetical protein